MQVRKTHFEQVPIRVAESALRLQTSGPRIVRQWKPVVKESRSRCEWAPRRLRRRRFSWLVPRQNQLTFVVNEKFPKKRGKHQSKNLYETNDMDQNHAHGGLGLLRMRLDVQPFRSAAWQRVWTR